MPHRRRAGLFLIALLATVLLLVVPAWAASLSLSQSSASPGDTIGVSGSGFAPEIRLKLCWDSDTCADLGRPPTDADGSFSTIVLIPDTTPGSHTIWACGAECASASLVVVVPDPPTTTTLLPPTTTLVASTTTLLPLTTTTFPATSTTLLPLTTTTLRTVPPLSTTTTVAKSTTTTARATTTALPTTTTVVAGSLPPSTTTPSPSPGRGAASPTTTTTSPEIGSNSFDRPFNEDSHAQPEAEVLGDAIVGDSGALEFAGSARTDSPATSNSLPNWLWIALIPVEIGLLAFIINSVVREVRRY